MNCSPPGSSVHGILQARILVLDELPFPIPGHIPDSGIKPLTPALTSGSFTTVAAAAAKSLQLCPTLCDPRDSSPWGSPVPGILQARTLEWVAISFSNAWKWKVKVKSLSCVHPQRPHGLQPTRLLHPWDLPGRVLEWGAIAFSVYHCTTWEYTASKMVLTLNFYLLIKITFCYKCFYSSFDPNWKWNAISLMRFIIILWKIGLKSTDPIFLFWADAFNMEYTLVNFIFIVQKWY